MWTNCRADHQPEHPSDRRAYGSPDSVSDHGANRASNRRAYGSPDWFSDHAGANNFCANSSDTASDCEANHLHADHLRAVPAPSHFRANYLHADSVVIC